MANNNPPLFFNNDQDFKRAFVTQFLAAYAATHYDDACARGDQDKLQRLPIEDAEFLANCAWEHWHNTLYPTPNKQDEH